MNKEEYNALFKDFRCESKLMKMPIRNLRKLEKTMVEDICNLQCEMHESIWNLSKIRAFIITRKNKRLKKKKKSNDKTTQTT